jgi:hypothetical protein
MKLYATKSGAQNNATRLNKIESANNSLQFWEVDSIVIDNEIKYYIYTFDIGIEVIFTGTVGA